MQASFKDQLKAAMTKLQDKTKEQPSQPCKQANSAFIWRITRSKDRFDRFDVVETCSNNLIWSAIDLDTAQELVELHNQQVEKWWEVKSSQPTKQVNQSIIS